MSKPNDIKQSDTSKPRPQNSAMMWNGRASVCAFSASRFRTFATAVFTATSSSGSGGIKCAIRFRDVSRGNENGFVGTGNGFRHADGEEKKAAASGSSVRRPRFGETSAVGIGPAGPRFYMHIPGRAADYTRATMVGVRQMRGGRPRG
jgi:hypothetical protein